MKNYFRTALDFLVNSNLFISACAYFFTRQACSSIYFPDGAELRLAVDRYAWLAGIAVFFIYGAQRLYYVWRASSALSPRESWYKRHFNLMLALVGISAVAVCILLFSFPFRLVLYLLPWLIVSLLYFAGPWPLRKIYGLKAFVIGLAWAGACVYVPNRFFLQLQGKDELELYWLSAGSFFFVAALCVPFDIRDVAEDKERQVRSLAVVYGAGVAKWIAVVLVLLYPVFLLWGNLPVYVTVSALCTAVISAVAFFFAREKRSPYYFSVLIDGLLLLQFVHWKLALEICISNDLWQYIG